MKLAAFEVFREGVDWRDVAIKLQYDPYRNYTKLYIYFIKDMLLPSWMFGADPEADLAKKGDDVDMLCLDWAAQHKVPLISFEGSGPSGPLPERLMPSEAAKRGIDLV